MSKLTVELPESLKRSIETLARTEGYTVDQFLASAAAEKIAAMRTLEYFRSEAAKGKCEAFERVLASVPSAPVPDTDCLLTPIVYPNRNRPRPHGLARCHWDATNGSIVVDPINSRIRSHFGPQTCAN
jgi:hypothetical protein